MLLYQKFVFWCPEIIITHLSIGAIVNSLGFVKDNTGAKGVGEEKFALEVISGGIGVANGFWRVGFEQSRRAGLIPVKNSGGGGFERSVGVDLPGEREGCVDGSCLRWVY